MVRVYVTPQELLEMPVGVALSTTLSSLGTNVLDKLMIRASARIDAYTRRRIQAPGSSTLSNSASAGATSISVASTLTLDAGADQAVIIGTGNTQETIMVEPGGVSVTSYASPYPGTITFLSALQYNHSSSEAVTYCYREVDEADKRIASDRLVNIELFPNYEAIPRVCFVRSYPIINLILIEQADIFTSVFSTIDANSLYINPREGWYRFLIWQTVIPQELLRTTYVGGFASVPEDVKLACSYYLAEEIQQYNNPFGLTELQEGKTRRRWGMAPGKSQLSIQAEEILSTYRAEV